MAKKVRFRIVNPSVVPAYRDGQVQEQAQDSQGNHLKLSPGLEGWYWAPESLPADQLKHYVSFDDKGNLAYIRIFDLTGDPVKYPELIGLPVQEIWIKYKYCQRLEEEPAPPAPPEKPGEWESYELRILGVILHVQLRKI